jgi:hypothetical protein
MFALGCGCYPPLAAAWAGVGAAAAAALALLGAVQLAVALRRALSVGGR